jgi:hypothetical protein
LVSVLTLNLIDRIKENWSKNQTVLYWTELFSNGSQYWIPHLNHASLVNLELVEHSLFCTWRLKDLLHITQLLSNMPSVPHIKNTDLKQTITGFSTPCGMFI